MHMYLSRVQQEKFLGKANERLATYLFLVVSPFEWKEDIREYRSGGIAGKSIFLASLTLDNGSGICN